jgi:uncharacterized membrane protein
MALPWSYTNRIVSDVARWRDAGFIDERGHRAIADDIATRKAGVSLPGVLAVLGATLIGFSAMTFVAANWQGMSKLVRLLILMVGLWSAYGGAALLFTKRLPMFGHAAVLAGSAVFGASIMLVAQMYHMEGNPPDAVLLWALGALVSGVVFRSGPSLALSMLGIGLWSGWEMQLTTGVHWAFLAGWAVVAGAFLWLRWRPGLDLSALTMCGWIISMGFKFPYGSQFWLIALIGFAIAGASAFATWKLSDALSGRIGAIAPKTTAYGLALGFGSLLIAQFWRSTPFAGLLAAAILTLALIVAALYWAMQTENRPALFVGYAAFSAEILALYFKTFGTLLNTSVIFGVGGLLIIALASLAFRLMKHKPQNVGVSS